MPRPSTGPKIFCTGPYFLCQTKDWIIICATSKYFVPAQILNLVNGNHIYRLAQNVEDRNNMCKWIFGIAQKSWTRPKHFGTCRRTRQKSFKWLCKQLCSQSFNMCKGPLYLKHVQILDETLHRLFSIQLNFNNEPSWITWFVSWSFGKLWIGISEFWINKLYISKIKETILCTSFFTEKYSLFSLINMKKL